MSQSKNNLITFRITTGLLTYSWRSLVLWWWWKKQQLMGRTTGSCETLVLLETKRKKQRHFHQEIFFYKQEVLFHLQKELKTQNKSKGVVWKLFFKYVRCTRGYDKTWWMDWNGNVTRYSRVAVHDHEYYVREHTTTWPDKSEQVGTSSAAHSTTQRKETASHTLSWYAKCETFLATSEEMEVQIAALVRGKM